jgi:hypothetical protein
VKYLFIYFILFNSIELFAQTNSSTSGNYNDRSKWVNPRAVWDGVNILNGHTISVPDGKTFYSGKITFTGTGKLNLNTSGKWMPNVALTALKNCKDIIDYYPMSISGVYTIDPDGPGVSPSISCYCDMDTDGGGWTLVLNYLHKGGTDPALKTFSSSLPLLGSTILGTDESNSTTTWGHVSNSYLNKFTFSDLRFYGSTNVHTRIIHFKTRHPNTISYFKTGRGSMSGISTSGNYTLFDGHTANLPQNAANYFPDEGDLATTNFPFWLSGTYHWGIKGHNYRWEVDDFNNSSSYNTFHQIWIR